MLQDIGGHQFYKSIAAQEMGKVQVSQSLTLLESHSPEHVESRRSQLRLLFFSSLYLPTMDLPTHIF